MQIQRVVTFIETLAALVGVLPPRDRVYHQAFVDYFQSKNPEHDLSPDDIAFIKKQFKERWAQVQDTEDDYMRTPEGINAPWISFAKDLEEPCQMPYFQLLLPTITNTHDVHDESSLRETCRIENFYLGEDDTTLYRKRALCDRLLANHYVLSTQLYIGDKKSSPLSVTELMRLKQCHQIHGGFAINGEAFVNFWDFLSKKVLVRLHEKGRMPYEFLPGLIGLIEDYFASKAAGAVFREFANKARHFFREVAHGNCVDVHYFYGVQIQYKGAPVRLLDLLIDISCADSYTLDEQCTAIALWFYRYNNALHATTLTLQPLYHAIQPKEQTHPESAHDVFPVLLSLLLVKFSAPFLGHVLISVWDRKNTLGVEGAELFKQLSDLIPKCEAPHALEQYQHIMRAFFTGKGSEFSESNKEWFDAVVRRDFSALGIHWYAPELLVHGALYFRRLHRPLSDAINAFIDEIIRTYTHDRDEHLKALRVNALFFEFISTLRPEDKKYLLRLLPLLNEKEAKEQFVSNCSDYIGNRLAHIDAHRTQGAVPFFGVVRRVGGGTLSGFVAEAHQLGAVIDAYKSWLGDRTHLLDAPLKKELLTYLDALSTPILSVDEMESARQSARGLDFVGAPR